jgi:hypothetical protein
MTKAIYRQEHQVPAFIKPWLEEQLGKINKTAVRLGWEPLELVASEIRVQRISEFGVITSENVFDFTIYGEAPRLHGGWKFVASLTHTDEGTIVSLAPDFYGDETDYSTFEARCEHCQTKRSRSTTVIVVSDEGVKKQIGSSCLKDFLGHQIASVWKFLDSLDKLFEEESHKIKLHPPTSFELLTAVSAIAEQIGWVSKSGADDSLKVPTVIRATELVHGRAHNLPADFKVTDEHLKRAIEIIEWVEALTPSNSYESNLRIAVLTDATDSHGGIVASAWVAHDKATKAEAVKEIAPKVDKTPAPLGKVIIEGVVVSHYVKDTPYGSRLVFTVQDHKGFTVWGSVPSSIEPKVGDTVRFSAEITGVSDKDESFGFFKRPTKAEILESVG